MTPEPSIWLVVGVASFPGVCTCQSRDDWGGREGGEGGREGGREEGREGTVQKMKLDNNSRRPMVFVRAGTLRKVPESF